MSEDTNPNNTPQNATFYNGSGWANDGKVPASADGSEMTFFSSSNGVTNGEKGIALWGDYNGRNQQQGKWFQWYQNQTYPLVSDNSGHWLFNPANMGGGLPTIASTIDVSGNITIGSAYAGLNAAPGDGLLVQGNVGIGTPTPGTYKLAVNGPIHAKAVTVDLTGFPDYVFKPAYILPALSTIKAYIDQNHHLPDIPSAAEIEKDGLNLGEMNKLLTKKVEELTLYLIDQDKKMKSLEARLQVLEDKKN